VLQQRLSVPPSERLGDVSNNAFQTTTDALAWSPDPNGPITLRQYQAIKDLVAPKQELRQLDADWFAHIRDGCVVQAFANAATGGRTPARPSSSPAS